MKIEIKHRLTGAIMFELECGSLRLAVEAAVKSGAYLGGAHLGGAHLGGAYLGGANLHDANLRDANLRGANLRGANLRDADLLGADLRGADLGGAYLGGAYLGGAHLRGAHLGGALLGGADLRGADLGGAYLRDALLGGRKINGDFGLIEAGTPNHWSALGFIDTETGDLIVSVGCRVKTIADGRAYWSSDGHPEREDRREALAALDYIEAVAKLRGWSASKSDLQGEGDGAAG